MSKHPVTEDFYSGSVEEYFKLGVDLPYCVPRSFGYTDQDAELIFPYTEFQTCENVMGTQNEIIWIDSQTRELHMTCAGTYFLGQSRKKELIGFDIYNGTSFTYNGPVKLAEEIEWAYGTCTGNTNKVEGATYILHKDELLKNSTKSRMASIQQQINSEYSSSEPTTPLTVLFLSIDSLSRKLFYRRLPKSYNYLKSLSPEQFRIFDFKLSNIIGDNSIPNVYSLLTGYVIKIKNKKRRREYSSTEEDIIKNSAIWTYMKEKGWVTMFATEFCDNYFANELGRKPSVDHLSCKFWCAAEKLSGFRDTMMEQRCIGNKNSHYYILNYTYQYIQQYQGVNKWAHIMTLPAHEDSGTVISSMDDDLVEFLQKLFATKDKVLLFILSDHGPRYGNWKKSLDGAQEHKLASLFLVAPTDLLKQMPSSFDILSYNTNRLVSKIDLFKTLQHITLLPYYKSFKRDSLQNNEWKSGHYSSYSLMLEKIPITRTCEDALIDKILCSCNDYSEVSLETQSDSNKLLINEMAEAIINEINEESQTNFNGQGWKFCDKLSLNQILSLNIFNFGRCRHAYRFEVTVNEHPEALIEAEVFILCTKVLRKTAKEFYDLRSKYLNGKLFIKVNYVKRIDNNPQADKVYAKGFSPHTCFYSKKLY